MTRIQGQLTLLNKNCRLGIPWLVGIYLNHLTPAYDNFKSNWISNNDFVDGENAKAALVDLMQAVKREESLQNQSSGRALLSHTSQSGDKPATACRYCKKLYHTAAECVVKNPHLKAALDKRLKEKRERRKKREGQKYNNSASQQQEEPTHGMLAIRGCGSGFVPAYDIDE